MARPKKIGLDYFPVDIKFDRKIDAIELLYGNDGIVWILKFWQEAYQTELGEIKLDGLFGELFAKNCRITTELHSKIIDTAMEIKLIYKTDDNFYTSNGIKKRMAAVSSERKKAIQRKERRKKIILKEIKVKESKTPPDCSANNNTPLKGVKIKLVIPDHLKEIWPDFLLMRKTIRKPATERAQKNILIDLYKLAPDNKLQQIAIIEQSIKNSWQGVFELKNNKNSEVRQYERL